MNRITLALKRPFIWLRRFRHRCGYGVHSPFAFNLITQVIYENSCTSGDIACSCGSSEHSIA